ncbi:lanosterol 14-alpha demethylase-like [Corticium candelabrum]|uniref:lanosterol 14-alpha demethylase-like n=1 Tax=Corticium candelabrum TaxID=121492 RepID=UPI002E25653E|nr:lanosterol 14-alpha demethylase-like [Corticium candelabrum]
MGTDTVIPIFGLETVSTEALLLSTAVVVSLCCFFYRRSRQEQSGAPPLVPYTIPFVGQAVEFGQRPIELLLEAYKKYGHVFTLTVMGQKLTYLIGSDASSMLFNAKNEDLNAEEVYGPIMTPIFGKGVAYDVPHMVFLEQKKMLKTALTIAKFKTYVPMIEEETKEYFKRWGDSGVRDLFQAMSEVIIMTASRCLQGREVRAMLYEGVADMYHDMDAGLTPAAWLLPGWLPLPSFRQRDRGHRNIKEIFYKVIATRRKNLSCGEELDDDILTFLMTTEYRDGRKLTDDEIAGLLIGLLMAGQHTSSTTSAWLGFFLAQNKAIQDECYAEQVDVSGEDLEPLVYEQLKDLCVLDGCVRETLRLRPPIMSLMRMAKKPVHYNGYTIPAGHQVCVSPTTNQRLESVWPNANTFNPNRFKEENYKESVAGSQKFAYVPFGAGRHRCVGEFFAHVQMKTVWSVLLRMFEFELVDGHFPSVNYATMIHTPTNAIIRYQARQKLE